MQLLDSEKIRGQLIDSGFGLPCSIEVLKTVDSTNRYLKDKPLGLEWSVCCAETQTAGRGRFGRYWHSPSNENIYLSIAWQWQASMSQLSGLSLVASLALLKSVANLNATPAIAVKWPNDLIWCDKKLSGTLIEIRQEAGGNIGIILGIGLNVNSDTNHLPSLDRPWCSLLDITGSLQDRNKLIANILVQLESYVNRFSQEGFAGFISEWKTHDSLFEQAVSVHYPGGTVHGKAMGVDECGQLIIEDDWGIKHFLGSGEASFSKKD